MTATPQRRRFGSIRRLASGRYQARYTDQSGQAHTAPNTFRTRAEADRYLASVETDLSRGDWTDPRRGRITFSQLVEIWRSGSQNLRPKTVATYAYVLRRLILPTFGDLPIAQIDKAIVRRWHSQICQVVSPSTAAKAYRLLRQILDVAVEDGAIPHNPCTIRGAASEPVNEREAATPEQVNRLVSAMDERYRVMVLLAAYTGLRWGELTALRWRHIDLLARKIVVEEQTITVDGGAPTVGPPKTAAGRRTVTLSVQLVDELEHHRRNWGEPGQDGLVFPAPEGGYLRHNNFRRRMWLPAVEQARLPGFRFHDLRHTHATLAMKEGADTRELMARMGHASPAAALRYQHRVPGRDEQIAEALGLLLAGSNPVERGGLRAV